MQPVTFFVLLGVLAGCATVPSAARKVSSTIDDNPRLPKGDIRSAFTATQWNEISKWKYDAFLIIDVSLTADGRVVIAKIRDSFPDQSWNHLADSLLKDVSIYPTNVGSHRVPKAEVYIVFFERVKDGRLALVYGRQIEIESPRYPSTTGYLNVLALTSKEPNNAPEPAPTSVMPRANESKTK